MPPTETPRPPLGYLPAGFAHRPAKPRAPPADSSVAPAPPAAPAENAMPPPAAAPANQQPEPAPLRRRSPRLNPVQGHAHAIKGPPPLWPSLTTLRNAPRWLALIHSPSTTTSASAGRPTLFPSPVYGWLTSATATASILVRLANLWMRCPNPWIQRPALLYRDTSPALDKRAFAIP